MRKVFTRPEYKLYHRRRSNKYQRRKRNKSYLIGSQEIKNQQPISSDLKNHVLAPKDFCLLTNTEACLQFFRDLRSFKHISRRGKIKFILMSLKEVAKIDYAAISILTSINDELTFKKIVLRGDFPVESNCRQFLIDSGYLNRLLDAKTGRPFPKAEKSEMIFFQKGAGILSLDDNIKISDIVKKVVEHLTGEQRQCLAVKTIILEICGNSIEWSGTDSQQWLLGVRYENAKVVFTVTDVGKGILETLHRKFGAYFKDVYEKRTNVDILNGAFNQKYGSSSQEINRNKGLPAVKSNFEQAKIKNLKVLTNNVILHFDNPLNSKTFKKGAPRFKGTFYQWEMTKECVENIN